jgi:hypothetical protein
MSLDTRLLINGQFVSGEGSEEAVLDPASGELIAFATSWSSCKVIPD